MLCLCMLFATICIDSIVACVCLLIVFCLLTGLQGVHHWACETEDDIQLCVVADVIQVYKYYLWPFSHLLEKMVIIW